MTRGETGRRLDRESGRKGWVIAIRGKRVGLWMRVGVGVRSGARMGFRVWEPGAVIVIAGIEETYPAMIQIIREEIYDGERTLGVQG